MERLFSGGFGCLLDRPECSINSPGCLSGTRGGGAHDEHEVREKPQLLSVVVSAAGLAQEAVERISDTAVTSERCSNLIQDSQAGGVCAGGPKLLELARQRGLARTGRPGGTVTPHGGRMATSALAESLLTVPAATAEVCQRAQLGTTAASAEWLGRGGGVGHG